MRTILPLLLLGLFVGIVLGCGLPAKPPAPVGGGSPHGHEFDPNNSRETAEWLSSRFDLLHKAQTNPLRKKEESDGIDRDLHSTVGQQVNWQFRFNSLELDRNGQVRLPHLSYSTGEALETVHSFQVVSYDPEADYSYKTDKHDVAINEKPLTRGVLVQATSDLASLKLGDRVIVSGRIKYALRRSGRNGAEAGILFILENVSARKEN
jgi:hypothetical protein